MSKELEEDIRVLEEYHIQVIEYKNGFKSVRDVNKNENCNGIYIYANEEKYNKRHIDELLENSISKDTIKEIIEKIKRAETSASECINERIVIADSDSLNFGRKEAHNYALTLLEKILNNK